MTRLLYVVNIPRFFVSHRLPLALAARAAGYEVHVATSSAGEEHIRHILAAGLPFHPLPLAQHGTSPLAEAKTLMALAALYRRLRPDLVHHVSIKPVLYGGIAARLAGVRAVVSAMSGLGYVFMGDDLRRRVIRAGVVPLLRWALGGHTRMIFQNPDDLARFVALGLVPAQRAVLIRGSGVDTAVYAPAPLPEGMPVVLFAGRLMWPKGLGHFVDAARLLRGRARFVVAGYPEPTSPDSVPLAQLEAWQAEGVVEWWGRRDDMPAVFAASHIVCLPSTYGEGVPKVLIEAASCGRPIVTTDTPGCREIVHDGVNGRLVPPGDSAALAQALVALLEDDAQRHRMGAAGRARVLAEYSLERVVAEVLTLYERLIAQDPLHDGFGLKQ
jgi:glycosyltransferase involved in cell wall biosynthesis